MGIDILFLCSDSAALLSKVLDNPGAIFGNDHEFIRDTLKRQVSSATAALDLETSVVCSGETLEAMKQNLGSGHPEAVFAASFHANNLRELIKLDEAEALEKHVIQHQVRLLGDDRPNLLILRGNLAVTLFK